MNNSMQSLSDQEIMEDILSSQKSITGVYNSFSNECTHQPLRDDFLNILREEHNIQSSVFAEMEKRGWYAPASAPEQKVNQTKTKFTNIASTL